MENSILLVLSLFIVSIVFCLILKIVDSISNRRFLAEISKLYEHDQFMLSSPLKTKLVIVGAQHYWAMTILASTLINDLPRLAWIDYKIGKGLTAKFEHKGITIEVIPNSEKYGVFV